MLQYYFSAFPEGKLRPLHKQLLAAGLSLVELEYYARRIKPQAETIANWIEQIPTRGNLLAYSLEVFYDMNWEGVSMSPERRQLVKTLRSICGVIKPVSVPEVDEEEAAEDEAVELLGRELEEELDELFRKLAKRERIKKPGLSSLFTSKGSEGSC